MIKRIARLTLAVVMAATAWVWYPTANTARAISSCPTDPLSSLTPYDGNFNDTAAVNVGVKFQVKGAPTVTGVKFYKGVDNTGTHVAHLYDVTTSTDVASETFTGETGSGWQSVDFSSPVDVTANHNYMVWVSMPNGHYAVDGTPGGTNSFYNNGFGDSTDVVRILQGNSGVYEYTSTDSDVPTNTGTNNYWVSPVVTDDVDPNAASAVSASDDTEGPQVSWTGGVSDTNSTYTASSSTVKTEFLRDDGVSTDVIGTQLSNTSYWLDPTNGTQQDSTALPGTTYTYGVRFTDGCGNVSSTTSSSSVATASQSLTDIFSSTAPANVDTATDPTTVGTYWQSSTSGTVWGARIYRAANTAPAPGTNLRAYLWDDSGNVLATGIVPTGNQQSGWIDVRFPTPVSVSANTDYIIGYYSPNGQEAYTTNVHSSAVTNGSLTARADTSLTPNSVYEQGPSITPNALPDNRAGSSTWYGVDVNFY